MCNMLNKNQLAHHSEIQNQVGLVFLLLLNMMLFFAVGKTVLVNFKRKVCS